MMYDDARKITFSENDDLYSSLVSLRIIKCSKQITYEERTQALENERKRLITLIKQLPLDITNIEFSINTYGHNTGSFRIENKTFDKIIDIFSDEEKSSYFILKHKLYNEEYDRRIELYTRLNRQRETQRKLNSGMCCIVDED